jgi:hypothetical protein
MSAKNIINLQKAVSEMRKYQRQMELTLAPIHADTNFALDHEASDKKNEQFWRRTIIRCLLAYIEALLWNLKQLIQPIALISNTQFTIADLEIIQEEKTVSIKGKIEIRRNHLKFRDNLKATFSLFGKAHGISFKINCNHDFDALCKIYDLRSRLMHPKKPFDLNVSDSDFAASKQGVAWLGQEYTRLMDACEPAMLQITKDK